MASKKATKQLQKAKKLDTVKPLSRDAGSGLPTGQRLGSK
jgi:hypothetical protein